MASRTINSRRNMIAGVINKVITVVFPFIIRTVINQKLGAEYLGLSSLFKSILTTLSLAELGISSAIVFSMYKPLAVGDTKEINALYKFYRKIYRIVGAIILIVGLLLLPFIPRFIKGTAPKEINIYIIYLIYLLNTSISYFLSAYKESLLVANQRNDISLNIVSACYVLMYTLQILAVVFLKNYYVYSILILVITVVINIVRSVVVKRLYPDIKCEGELSENSKEELKKKVLGLMVYKISEVCRNSFDSLIISPFLGLIVLANYQNYYYIMSAVIGVFGLISNAIIASIGNSIVTESKSKNQKDFNAILLIYGWLASWCTCCLACLYQPFMRLWMGEANMFSFEIVILFCIYFFALSIANVCFTYRQAAGLWWEDRFRPVVEALSNLVLNIILVQAFGVAGILISTIITIVLLNIPLSIRVLYKNYFGSSTKPYWTNLGHITLIAVASCFICISACSVVRATGWTELILKGIICLIIPNLVLGLTYWKFKDFARVKEILINMMPKRIKNILAN